MRVPTVVTPHLVATAPPPAAASRVADYFRRNRNRLVEWSSDAPEGLAEESYWRDKLHKYLTEIEEDRGLRVKLFLRDRGGVDGPVIGLVSFSQLERGPIQSAKLGYSLDGEHVGRGLMHEALTALLPLAWTELGLHRVIATYAPANEKSGAVLRRLSFVVEGYARDYFLSGGVWHDHIVAALVRPRP
jgi:ribosomal-protein-alanine N-acetyltransferase